MRSSYAKINIRRNEERTYNVVIKHMDETEWFEIADRAVNIVINNDTNGGCEVVAACRNFSRPDFGGCVPRPQAKLSPLSHISATSHIPSDRFPGGHWSPTLSIFRTRAESKGLCGLKKCWTCRK